MTLSVQAREALASRDQKLTRNEQRFVDTVMDSLPEVSTNTVVPIAGDDRMAELEAALIIFVIASRE